jgi:hypothetical protein
MPAPIFMTLGNLAFKGVQGAGKAIAAGWKVGKIGAGNQIAGNTTAVQSYGSDTMTPVSQPGEPKNNNMLYILGAGAAVVLFFLMKKK